MSELKEVFKELIKAHGVNGLKDMLNEVIEECKGEMQDEAVVKPKRYGEETVVCMSAPEKVASPHLVCPSKVTSFGAVPSATAVAEKQTKEEIDFDSLPLVSDNPRYGGRVWGERVRRISGSIYNEDDYLFGTKVLGHSILDKIYRHSNIGISKKPKAPGPDAIRNLLSNKKKQTLSAYLQAHGDVQTRIDKAELFKELYFDKHNPVFPSLPISTCRLGELNTTIKRTVFDFRYDTKVVKDVEVKYAPAHVNFRNAFLAVAGLNMLLDMINIDSRTYGTINNKSKKGGNKYEIVKSRKSLISSEALQKIVNAIEEVNAAKSGGYQYGFKNADMNPSKQTTLRDIANSIRMILWETRRKDYDELMEGVETHDYTRILRLYDKLTTVIEECAVNYRQRALIMLLHKFDNDRFLKIQGNCVTLDEAFYNSELVTEKTAKRWLESLSLVV